MDAMATDALTAVAEELYALVPEEFTAARNARARAVKPDDPELAGRIGGLRKPSPAAWTANALARERADALEELVALGGELRDAQAAGDGRALTRLAAERRTLVGSLLQQAGGLADAADRSPSRAVLDEVEQTLIAGTVDPAAGEALRTGRLVRSLQAVGFDAVDLAGAVAGEASAALPVTPRRASSTKTGTASHRDTATGARTDAAAERSAERADAERAGAERARAERDRADADVRDARDRADAAQRALAEAEDALHDAESHADRLRAERDRIEARLRELRAEIAAAERDEREAERTRAKAATAADRARDHAGAAETARERLG